MSYLNYVLNAKREKNTFVFYKESFDVFELCNAGARKKDGFCFLAGNDAIIGTKTGTRFLNIKWNRVKTRIISAFQAQLVQYYVLIK